MPFLTIQHAAAFLQTDPVATGYIRSLVQKCLDTRTPFAHKDTYPAAFTYLHTLSLAIDTSEKTFWLNFDSLPVCMVLMETAEMMLQEKLPENPVAALRYVNRFAERIRQPEPRTAWYGNLRVQLETYALVYLHQVYQVDITAFVRGLTQEMSDANDDLFTIDNTYRYVFPYLEDSTGRQFDTVTWLLTAPRTRNLGLDALHGLAVLQPDKAISLYRYARSAVPPIQEGFLGHLLTGLYESRGKHWLEEAITLFTENPAESLFALTWFEYNDPRHIATAFGFLEQQDPIFYQAMLVIAWYRLSKNRYTPVRIRKVCSARVNGVV